VLAERAVPRDRAALDKVSTNLAALKTSAKSQRSSQLIELDGAAEALKTTIARISGDSLATDRHRLDDAAAADRPGLRFARGITLSERGPIHP
jgi:hypothetical protein